MQMVFGWKYQFFPKKSLALGFFRRTTKPKWTNEERATAMLIKRTLFNEDLPYDVIYEYHTRAGKYSHKMEPRGQTVAYCKTDELLAISATC